MSIDELVTRARKKIKGTFWDFGDKDYTGAAELYTQAANLCLAQNQKLQAIELYKRAAECYLTDKNQHRTIEIYNKIVVIMKATGQLRDAIRTLELIIILATPEGYWHVAAKAQESLADIYKQEGMIEEALTAYQKTVDFYGFDNNQHTQRRCYQEMFLLHILLKHYTEAIQIYDELAKNCDSDIAGKYRYPGYVMMIVICHLVNADLVAAKRYFTAACNETSAMVSSYEGRFVKDILEAVEANDVDNFTQTVRDLDQRKPLDSPLAELLLEIKNQITPLENNDLT